MKKIYFLAIFVFLYTGLTSCNSSNDEANNNSKAKQESVDSAIKKSLYQRIMEIGGDKLPLGDKAKWINLKGMITSLDSMVSHNSDAKIKRRNCNKIFKQYGYKKYRDGYSAVEHCSEKVNFILNIGLKVASLETVEVIKSSNELAEAKRNIINELKNAGYSQMDVKFLDKYENVFGKSVELLVKLPLPLMAN